MGIYFIISAIFYSVLLNIIYRFKRHVDSPETAMFSSILGLNLIGLILELVCSIVGRIGNNILLSTILAKLYLLYLMTFLLLFTLYIYIVCYRISANKKIRYYNVLHKLSYIIYYVAAVAMIFMPIHVYQGYADGMGVDFVYLCSVVCFGIWLFSIIKNFRRTAKTKFLPIALFIVLALVVSIIQKNYPTLTIMTAVQTFVIFSMFFTIENPDVKMIEELNLARDQALKASSAKSKFLSSVSHEIRIPLNTIVDFSTSLINDTDEPKIKEDAKYIMEASSGLLELVNGMLDFSKIEDNKMELINADYEVKEVIDNLVALSKARLDDKPIDLRVQIDKDLPEYLNGDSSRLKQICLNLLTNSIKYTKQGTIDFKVDSIIKGDICRLIVTVEDTGIGIKEEDIDNLFTKFSRLDIEKNQSIEGSGLGLAITKRLVDMMNGKIIVESKYGLGSKFIVAVDQNIVDDTLPKENTSFYEEENIDFSSKRVLVVDDNKLNLRVAEKLLEPFNVTVVTVESGDEAIERIVQDESYDLVLLDDMMPSKTGAETLRELKENLEGYKTPTVALTANAISGMKEKYINEGFDDYLAKPIVKSELARILNKFLK